MEEKKQKYNSNRAYTELIAWVNRNSIDSEVEIPDYIIAEFMLDCFFAMIRLKMKEKDYYGREES